MENLPAPSYFKGNQQRIYEFVVNYIQDHGMSPTNREIGRAIGIGSMGHVEYFLAMLEKKGLISRQPKTGRGIKLILQPLEIQKEERLKERRLKVFLCHSSDDKLAVRNLCQRLRASIVDPWLDEESLLPGQEWEYEIRKAVRDSDAVIVCLSCRSISKTGFVQKEIRFALDVADEQPENSIFIIPLKLEECEVPQRLRQLHWVNLFDEKGYNKLMDALRKRAFTLEVIQPFSE